MSIPKKPNAKPAQLSLFDLFTTSNTQNNETDRNTLNDSNNTGNLRDQSQENSLQSAGSGGNRSTDLQPDGFAATGQDQPNVGRTDPETLPGKTQRILPPTNGTSSTESGGDLTPHSNTSYPDGRNERDSTDSRYRPVNLHRTYKPSNNITLKTFSKPNAFADNITALQTTLKLLTDKIPPTPADQEQIASYRGFGGLKEILLDPANEEAWNGQPAISKQRVQTIHELVNKIADNRGEDPQKWLQGIKRSTLSAHFTPDAIIDAIYQLVLKTGFKGGKILDPSSGTGKFLTMLPKEIAENAVTTAIELDPLTGQLLKKILPETKVNIQGFERTVLPQDHFDLIITNVPFGQIPIYDPFLHRTSDKRFEKASSNLHNFFIAKSILIAKPGSLLAFVTSRYTLDSSENNEIRELMGDYCNLVTALRLPDSAFITEAGTEVVADIIILQKREKPILGNLDNPLLHVQKHEFTDLNNIIGSVIINNYFLANPNHILGQNSFASGMFRENNYTVTAAYDDPDLLRTQIINIGSTDIPEPLFNQANSHVIVNAHTDERLIYKPGIFDTIGNIVQFPDGYIGRISVDELQKQDDQGNPVTYRYVDPVSIRKEDAKKVGLLIQLRQDLKKLIYYEVNGYKDEFTEPVRKTLLLNYTNFTRSFGNIISPVNSKLLKLDATDSYLLSSLQRIDPNTKKIYPADILTKRTIQVNHELNQVDNLKDAIDLSIHKFGELRIEYISQLLNKDQEELLNEQQNPDALIFLTPDGLYQTRDQYLSGNVIEKLETAKKLAEEDSRFLIHVKALTTVLPARIKAIDIYSPIHARWIPKEYIEAFLSNTTKGSLSQIGIHYSKSADEYKINFIPDTEEAAKFRSKRRSAAWIFEHVLNGVEPIVTYTEDSKTYTDHEDTLLAKENFRKIQNLWDDFKYTDQKRRSELEDIYNYHYNNTVLRNFEGSGDKLSFPGLVGYIPLSQQKDAAFRVVQTMGGILDHIVGSGKTLCQIIISMELRRLKLANKPMILGLKAQIPDLYKQFKIAYPLAKILYPTEKDFQKSNRKQLLSSIATNDWDCIILSHDQFTRIKQNPITQERTINEMMDCINSEIALSTDKQEIKRLEARRYKYEQKLERLSDTAKDVDILDFSQLGIDFLIVDESHEFKNLEFATRLRNVTGLGNPEGSKKAFNLLMACRHIQEMRHDDKGILFCSGTTISNSVSELYLLQKFLTPTKLEQLYLDSFDKWASVYASIYSDLEYYLGRYKVVNRIREFKNLPELITMYRQIADVRNDSNLKLDKPKAIHHLVKLQPSSQQLEYIEKLFLFVQSKGADYRHELGLTQGYDSQTGRNNSASLLAINMAKKLSLDPRLISPHNQAGTKIAEACNEVYRIYSETTSFRGTQLIFLDLSTPKTNNTLDNLYDFFEGDLPDELGIRSLTEQERTEIFGENYYDSPKPKLQTVRQALIDTLAISTDQLNYCVQLANDDNGGFNAYHNIKTELMKRGIPENEVVFIHSFNTKLQKEKIYKDLNDGTVRIMLGSTSKMGTGVNVQYRLSALHHIDINWKPSHLIQRNGRGERQGNWAAKTMLENTIPVYYYATERTFDSYMYNLNGIKSRFIDQMKMANITVREIKDINEDIDLSTMGAELSGNPIVKEKATLEKRINELKSLKRSFNNQYYDAQDSIRRSTKSLEYTKKSIEKYDRLLIHIKQLPKDPETNTPIVHFEINGQSYIKPGEAGNALLELLEKKRNSILNKHSGKGFPTELIDKTYPVGLCGGYTIMCSLSSINPNAFLQDPTTEERIGSEKALSASPAGAAMQLRNTFLSAEQIKAEVFEAKNRHEQSIKNAHSIMELKFEHDPELESSVTRLLEIDTIIFNELQEAAKQKHQETQQEEETNKTIVEEDPISYQKIVL